jgi:Lysyl oxidase/Bacterial Ig domain
VTRPRAIRRTVLGAMAAAVVGCGLLVGLGSAAAPADEPNLQPLLPTNLSNANDRWVDTKEVPGRTLFRFDTVILNAGSGAFEVYRDASGNTYQRVWNGGDPGGDGTTKSFPAGAPGFQDLPIAQGADGQANELRYSAAYGHDHFHSQRIAAYTLVTTDGRPVKEASKNFAGFCLYDSWGPPASGAPTRYPGAYPGGAHPCAGGEPGYTGLLRMGIQRNWGDFYGSQLYDQWVDVTDVAPGTYRLRATVDPDNLYAESDETDNTITGTVVVPGVVVAPHTVVTSPGAPVSVPLSATVVGAGVRSRLPGCAEDDTGKPSCMTTATPGAATLAVQQPPARQGSVKLSGSTAVYTPPAGFTGTATFTYTGSDSRGLTSKPATVTVKVAAGSGGTTGAPKGRTGRIRLTARQMLISQRIGQAAIRRLNAVEAKLDGKPAPAPPAAKARRARVTLSARQLRINQRIFQAAVRKGEALEARLDGRPAPAAKNRPHDVVRLSVRQMVINQHIAQAAVRKANALSKRVGL